MFTRLQVADYRRETITGAGDLATIPRGVKLDLEDGGTRF